MSHPGITQIEMVFIIFIPVLALAITLHCCLKYWKQKQDRQDRWLQLLSQIQKSVVRGYKLIFVKKGSFHRVSRPKNPIFYEIWSISKI